MVPTFTSISPTSGHSGGRLLALVAGTNFRLSVVTARSVRVEIGGVFARVVDVISATLLHVSVPAYRGDPKADPIPAQDVVVTNLDDAGAPIVGETVTAAAAFTYFRAPIRPPEADLNHDIYRQIIYEVRRTFARQVHPNTAIGTNVDFGETGEVTIAQAEVPGVTLAGPRIAEDLINRHRWGDFFSRSIGGMPEEFERLWPGYVATFEFDVILSSNSKRELYAMIQSQIEMFMRTPYLEIPEDLLAPNGEQMRFPFELTVPPAVTTQDGNSNLTVATSTFQVRWVPFRFPEPVERGSEVLEGNLQTGAAAPPDGPADPETVIYANVD